MSSRWIRRTPRDNVPMLRTAYGYVNGVVGRPQLFLPLAAQRADGLTMKSVPDTDFCNRCLTPISEVRRLEDAKRQGARAAAVELEERAVLGENRVRARCDRGLDEFLVVRVAALRQAGARGLRERALDAARKAARLRERGGLGGGGDAVLAKIVGQHARELGVAGGVDVDRGAAEVHGVAQPPEPRVVEHQPVEPDLRVEDEAQDARAQIWYFSR